jgi:hypothetical protein
VPQEDIFDRVLKGSLPLVEERLEILECERVAEQDVEGRRNGSPDGSAAAGRCPPWPRRWPEESAPACLLVTAESLAMGKHHSQLEAECHCGTTAFASIAQTA